MSLQAVDTHHQLNAGRPRTALTGIIILAFVGMILLAGLASAIVTRWLAKSACEATVTPLTYGVVNFLKRQEGMDVYDCETRFNPLSVAE